MNIQEIYSKATVGSLAIDTKGNPLQSNQIKDDLLALQQEKEQHFTWLNLQQTRDFLGYLERTASDLVEVASSASMTAESDMDIRLLMVQHNKIKEIIDYARRNNSIYSDSSSGFYSKSSVSVSGTPV